MNIQSYNKGSASFRNTLNYIKRDDKFLCQNANGNGEINPNYIRNAFKGTDIVIVSRTPERQTRSNDAIKGFCLVKIKHDHLYIDVLCAKGGGLLLVKRVEQIARRMNKPYLMLNALPSVINLYKTKLGFVHTEKSCTEDPEVAALGQIVKNRKYSSSNNATNNAQFANLLKKLIELKLTAVKGCRGIKSCSEDGFTMTKCLT